MCIEQGEDMQGYVTELIITLEAVVENLDSDFRPMDIMKVKIFYLNNYRF